MLLWAVYITLSNEGEEVGIIIVANIKEGGIGENLMVRCKFLCLKLRTCKIGLVRRVCTCSADYGSEIMAMVLINF